MLGNVSSHADCKWVSLDSRPGIKFYSWLQTAIGQSHKLPKINGHHDLPLDCSQVFDDVGIIGYDWIVKPFTSITCDNAAGTQIANG